MPIFTRDLIAVLKDLVRDKIGSKIMEGPMEPGSRQAPGNAAGGVGGRARSCN